MTQFTKCQGDGNLSNGITLFFNVDMSWDIKGLMLCEPHPQDILLASGRYLAATNNAMRIRDLVTQIL